MTSHRPPITESPASSPSRATTSTRLAGIVLLILVAVLTVLDQVPPSPASADAAPSRFSADRAHQQIERFAEHPHPIGTAEHDRVRDHLLAELRALGLNPQVHEAVGVPPARLGEIDGLVPVGRVQNIVAVIEGTDPTGQLLLTAHYDSVPAGPGANDDGAGVGTILEVTRAITADPDPPRNDIVLLLTDAEEVGLLGAEAFTHGHPLADEGGVVINHESRGSSGAVTMFRSTPGSEALVRIFADVAPHPAADSTSTTIFEYLPNDTDLTAFRQADLAVMDFAYAGGSARYHSAVDTPPNVDQRSLQQMGANTLAMTRHLGEANLAELTGGEDDAVYFNVPPGVLVHFGEGWAVPVAVLSVLLTVGAIVLARVRREITIPRLLAGFVAVLVLLGLSGAAGALYWSALVRLRPDFALLLTGTPYEPLWFHAGATALLAALVALWYVVLRRVGVWALWLGALTVLTALGVAGVVVSPQLAPMLMPAPFAALGAVVGLWIRRRDDPVRLAVLTVGLIPTASLVLAAAWIIFDTGLQSALFAALPLMALSFALMTPLAMPRAVPWRRALVVPGVAAVAAVAMTAAGITANPADRRYPIPTMLTYTLDADTGEAFWAVPARPDRAAVTDAWASGYVEGEITKNPAPDTSWPQARVGPAEPVALDPPGLTVLSDETVEGERTVQVAVTSSRSTEALALAVDDKQGRVSAVTVEGRELTPKPADDGTVGVVLYAPAPDRPVIVQVRFTAAGGPLKVRLANVDALPAALDDLPGYSPPPDDRYLAYARLTVFTRVDL